MPGLEPHIFRLLEAAREIGFEPKEQLFNVSGGDYIRETGRRAWLDSADSGSAGSTRATGAA